MNAKKIAATPLAAELPLNVLLLIVVANDAALIAPPRLFAAELPAKVLKIKRLTPCDLGEREIAGLG